MFLDYENVRARGGIVLLEASRPVRCWMHTTYSENERMSEQTCIRTAKDPNHCKDYPIVEVYKIVHVQHVRAVRNNIWQQVSIEKHNIIDINPE